MRPRRDGRGSVAGMYCTVMETTARVLAERRTALDTDAGGDDAEESAVCYLQVLLADALPGVGRDRLFADMDAWGYSFRLGSARAWFERDAQDACLWLRRQGLTDAADRPTGRCRG